MAFTCSVTGMSRQPSTHLRCSTSVTRIVNDSGLTNLPIELGILLVHPSLLLFSQYCQCTAGSCFFYFSLALCFKIYYIEPSTCIYIYYYTPSHGTTTSLLAFRSGSLVAFCYRGPHKRGPLDHHLIMFHRCHGH